MRLPNGGRGSIESREVKVEIPVNTFNHARFDGNGSVDGDIDNAAFGKLMKEARPRISQVALKFLFSKPL